MKNLETTAATFSSGSIAMMSLLQALNPGDHVIAPGDMYFGLQRVMREIFVPWGLDVSFIDMTSLGALEQSLKPSTRLVIVESPSNPQLKITDIQAVVDLAKSVAALVVVDNTIPTPVLQRPFALPAHFALKPNHHHPVRNENFMIQETTIRRLRRLTQIFQV